MNILYKRVSYSATFSLNTSGTLHWEYTVWKRFQSIPSFDEWLLTKNQKLLDQGEIPVLIYCFINKTL